MIVRHSIIQLHRSVRGHSNICVPLCLRGSLHISATGGKRRQCVNRQNMLRTKQLVQFKLSFLLYDSSFVIYVGIFLDGRSLESVNTTSAFKIVLIFLFNNQESSRNNFPRSTYADILTIFGAILTTIFSKLVIYRVSISTLLSHCTGQQTASFEFFFHMGSTIFRS